MAILIALAYASRITEGKPDPQVLYEWSTFASELIQDGVILVLVLLIAGFDRRLLALRWPERPGRAVGLAAIALVAAFIFEGIYSALAHPGNEQGLTPSHWEPHHAVVYIANGIVICTFVPFVEELTWRGLVLSALTADLGNRRAWPIAAVAYGAAHVPTLFTLADPTVGPNPLIVFAALGCGLVWSFVASVLGRLPPVIVSHAVFSYFALAVLLPRFL